MKKEQKNTSIELAKNIFAENPVFILVGYKKLNAKGMSSLRKTLKSKGANLRILKNTLVKKAITDSEVKSLMENFKDQIAISYSSDAVSLSNALINFSKENEAVDIKIGFMDGKVLELNTIKSLSSLGSIEEVRAKFIGLLKAPGSKLARVLGAYETKLNENTAK
ncbi:MAG TPA: 50S ribosomal protein L10 [Rickettsiales bacterium]|nr:50S ribosomal protein L10 [Rickettsiales bacterium]